MPTTRTTAATLANKVKKVRVVKSSQVAKAVSTKTKSIKKAKKADNLQTNPTEETSYERILRKVQERRKAAADEAGKQPESVFQSDSEVQFKIREPVNDETVNVSANFEEDGVVMSMGVNELEETFPMDEDMETESSANNNATITNEYFQGSQSASGSCEGGEGRLPAFIDAGPGTSVEHNCYEPTPPNSKQKTFELMQSYLLKRGLINELMSEDEINSVLTEVTTEEQPPQCDGEATKRKSTQNIGPAAEGSHKRPVAERTGRGSVSSDSEVTIYKRAVKTLSPQLNAQIEELLNASCNETQRKVSYSSDETMNTSDETVDDGRDFVNTTDKSLVDSEVELMETRPPTQVSEGRGGPATEDQAERLIRAHERSKAMVYEVPGMVDSVINTVRPSVSSIDEDYQMIDSHVEDSVKR